MNGSTLADGLVELALSRNFNPKLEGTPLRSERSFYSKEYLKYVDNRHPQALELVTQHLGGKLGFKNKLIEIVVSSGYDTRKYGICFNYLLIAVYPKLKCLHRGLSNLPSGDFNYDQWRSYTDTLMNAKTGGIKPKYYLLLPHITKDMRSVTITYSIVNGDVVEYDGTEAPLMYHGKLQGLFKHTTKQVKEVTPYIANLIRENESYLDYFVKENKTYRAYDLIRKATKLSERTVSFNRA